MARAGFDHIGELRPRTPEALKERGLDEEKGTKGRVLELGKAFVVEC